MTTDNDLAPGSWILYRRTNSESQNYYPYENWRDPATGKIDRRYRKDFPKLTPPEREDWKAWANLGVEDARLAYERARQAAEAGQAGAELSLLMRRERLALAVLRWVEHNQAQADRRAAAAAQSSIRLEIQPHEGPRPRCARRRRPGRGSSIDTRASRIDITLRSLEGRRQGLHALPERPAPARPRRL